MKRIMPFLLLLFVTFSCSNSMLDSTDISICFDISQLSDNFVKVARNSTLVTDGKSYNEIKVKVTLYELNGSVDIPTEYSQFDASKYKQITEVQNYANTDGIVSVVLKEIPIGIKSFVVVEIYDEEGASPFYAGLSKVFEVLEGTNVVDIELKKKETSTTYTLTLIYPNNDESTCDYSQGDPASIPSKVPGYNLEGWYDNPDYEGEAISYITVDKNITLYAKGTPIIYNISYILGDDANWITDIYPRTFSVEEVIELPTEDYLAKIGYNFMGWFIDETCTIGITTSDNYYENLTVYAKWEAILYNITYELNGGTWADGFNYEKSYTIESAADLVLPTSEHLTKQGFVFDGWYDNSECTEYAIDSLVGRTGDLTLYAKWRDVNQVATVKFSPAADGVDMGTLITLSCATEGATIYYTIDGSDPQTSENRTTYSEDAPICIKAATTIKAYATKANAGMKDSDVATITYTLNVYTLNFDATGGTLLSDMQSSVQVTSGDTYKIPSEPTKTGYKFIGWYLSETPAETENSIQVYAPNIENTQNKTVTFYAKWEPITYTVIFNPNGGTATTQEINQSFTYDVEKELNANPFTRTGYTFKGWNTVEAPTTENPGVSYNDKELVKNLTTTSERITLYAQWEANKATITVTMPTYSDIPELEEPTKNDDGSLTFKAPESPADGVTYEHNIWYVNGVYDNKNKYPTNKWTFNTSNGGIYTIMLVVEDSNGNKYSAEWQITVEK